MYCSKTKNEALRSSSFDWMLLWRLPIQNHLKLSITEERRSKAKYPTWNSIGFEFLKKTSMARSVESLEYIKYHISSSPRPIKCLRSYIQYNCQKVCSWSWRPEAILEIRKEATILEVINKPIIYKFFKGFTNRRKETNRAVVFSQRPLPSILKYRDHRWNLPTIWKTRSLQKHMEGFSY